jgi:hypothetical protein
LFEKFRVSLHSPIEIRNGTGNNLYTGLFEGRFTTVLKQWFQFSPPNADAESANVTGRNGRAFELAEVPAEAAHASEPSGPSMPESGASGVKFVPFEDIYRNAPVNPSKVACDILKIAEMVNSPHLAGMSAGDKHSSLLMAIESFGFQPEDLLQDAMVRQRALNDYEEIQQKKLKDFEALKAKENNIIQAELERLSAVHLARMQVNMEELARQQDNFRLWKKRKQQESERIAEAAAFCAPQGTAANGGGLAATLARCGVEAVGARR